MYFGGINDKTVTAGIHLGAVPCIPTTRNQGEGYPDDKGFPADKIPFPLLRVPSSLTHREKALIL